ncbi:hypothetical protein SH449x_002018 [Pirellulaceae bacterium SH449]
MKKNRVLFATAIVLLWTMNTLDLQPFEFELRSTVALSSHRVDLLRDLAKRKPESSQNQDRDNIRLVGVNLVDVSESAPSAPVDSELQTARIRVRFRRFTETEAIEKWLEFRTRPQSFSDACTSLKTKINIAKWRLDSYEHTQRIVMADLKRQEEQLALQEPEQPGKVRFVGFQKTVVTDPTAQHVMNSLAAQIESERQNIDKLSKEFERELIASQGFLQFSGAPKWFPVAESIGWRRGIAFLLLSLSIWGVLRYFSREKALLHRSWNGLFAITGTLTRPSLSIPHFGHVELGVENSSEELNSLLCDTARDTPTRVPHSIERLIHFGLVGGFTAWGGVLLLRFVFDPAWRSLFITAPLSALTHLLTGVRM